MSKCHIWIEIDDPDRVYHPGDTVGARVHVDVDEDVTCDGLEVTRQWSTHGRGNAEAGDTRFKRLFSGEWKAGTTHSYRVEFVIPNGPYSYHGHYLNVDWYVRARADIPWAFDPKAEADFFGSAGQRHPCGQLRQRRAGAAEGRGGPG